MFVVVVVRVRVRVNTDDMEQRHPIKGVGIEGERKGWHHHHTIITYILLLLTSSSLHTFFSFIKPCTLT